MVPSRKFDNRQLCLLSQIFSNRWLRPGQDYLSFVNNSLLDGIEMIQDMKLKEELAKDKEFVDLHDKFSKKI